MSSTIYSIPRAVLNALRDRPSVASAPLSSDRSHSGSRWHRWSSLVPEYVGLPGDILASLKESRAAEQETDQPDISEEQRK